MADIFISYSKGEPGPTESLAAALRARGYTVWWDTNVLTGDNFRDVIVRELKEAAAVIVVWTKRSVRSEWVISEATRAKQMRKLIPIRTREIGLLDIPPPFDVLQTDFCDDMERILNALRAINASPSGAPTLVSAAARRDVLDRIYAQVKAGGAVKAGAGASEALRSAQPEAGKQPTCRFRSIADTHSDASRTAFR